MDRHCCHRHGARGGAGLVLVRTPGEWENEVSVTLDHKQMCVVIGWNGDLDWKQVDVITALVNETADLAEEVLDWAKSQAN